MKKLTAAALTLAATALVAAPARAQIPTFTPFAFEARAGAAIPTGDMNEDTGPGLALSGSVTYHAIPLVGIYAGGTYNKFSLDDGDGVDVSDTGLDIGARVGIPTPLIPIDPWIKGGVVVHRLKISDSEDDSSSDWGTGFEVGAGLGFGFGPVSITPGVGYVSYKANGDEIDNEDFTVSYFKADIGVRIRL
ncbi:MAG TPA: outer membrane beta-barrel protein [Longimicrobium sp.]|nr:outer membrane beta-barrel protein [Longimicrobium sp.]